MGLQRTAFFGVIALLVVYVGFLIYAVGFEPSPEVHQPNFQTANAKLTAEDAIRQLSLGWKVETLSDIVDRSMLQAAWYSDLKAKLPIFREDLGSLLSMESTAAESKKEVAENAKLVIVTTQCQYEKGSTTVKMLVGWKNGAWKILLFDIVMASSGVEDSSRPPRV